MACIGNHGLNPGETFRLALHASDPEGDAPRFIIAGEPEDVEFIDHGDGSAEFSRTPTEEQIRNYPLLFRVIDDNAPLASDWEEATFTVGEINRPPRLAPIGNRNGTALFRWTPLMEQVGSHSITFQVIDNDPQATESDSETIMITIGSINRPPVINPMGDKMLDVGEWVWLPVIASDPDGDPIDLSALDLPDGSAFTDYGDSTGEFYWSAQVTVDNPILVTFVAIDLGLPPQSTNETVSLTVRTDCELPEAPDDLKARITKRGILLRWEYEEAFDHFLILRQVDNGDLEQIATTTLTSFTDRNPPSDFSLIEYQVIAVNDCGESLPTSVFVRPRGR